MEIADIEICEDIRHIKGMKEIYDLRKETIERTFGDAKENHGMRFAHYNGKHLRRNKQIKTKKKGLIFLHWHRVLAGIIEKFLIK